MTEAKERHRVPAGREVQVAPANEPPAIVASGAENMLRTIAEAAANPYCDAEKMKALHQLLKDIEEHEGKKAFTRAFNALQFELPTITRDGKIDHSADGGERTRSGKKALKSAYSTYPNMMAVLRPLLKKHGFTLSNVIEPTPDGAKIHVVGYLDHIQGHSRISRFPLSIDSTGGKNNQQGWGSSAEYGRRYNAIALLNIVSEAPQDQDNDGYQQKPKPRSSNDPEVPTGGPISKQEIREHVEGDFDFPGDRVDLITEEQAAQLREAIDACGVPTKTFCDKYQIDRVAALPLSRLADALAACKNYGAAKHG